MSLRDKEAVQRLFSQFIRDALGNLPPEDRARYQTELQKRADDFLRGVADGASGTGFVDLIGLGTRGPLKFDEITEPFIESDFDAAVIQSQLHAAAELYYLYQHERMKVFQVVTVLLRLWRDGRIRIQ